MSNNKKALKSGFWYTISSFFVKSIGFITTPIFTRLLSKSDFGLFNNYTSWLSIITIFVTLNLESTLISARFDYEDDFDGYIFSMIGLSGLSSVFWICITQIFGVQISDFTHVDTRYLNIMMVYLLFLPPLHMFITRERYLFKYKWSVLVSCSVAIGTALVSVILVKVMEEKLLGRIIGAAVPSVIFGVFFFFLFLRKGKKIKISYWKYAFPICLPYIPHLLAGTLLNSMDRVMIERFCGSEDTAIYSLAYSCGALVTLFITALNSAFAPWVGEKIHQEKYKEINDFSKIYISLFMVLAVGIMLVAPDVLFVLGGKPYLEAKYVITPVAMGCVCQFLYTLYVNVEQFKKKTLGMAIATIIATLTNYILNYFFIPKVGYLAAAYTTLAGFLILLIIHMLLVKKLNLLCVYNTKYVIAAVIAGVFLMVGITFSYEHLIIRAALIIVYIIGCLCFVMINKNKLKNIIRLRRSEA